MLTAVMFPTVRLISLTLALTLIATGQIAKSPVMRGEVQLIAWDADAPDSQAPFILACGDEDAADRSRVTARIGNPSFLDDGYLPVFPDECCEYLGESADVTYGVSPATGQSVSAEWYNGFSDLEVRGIEELMSKLAESPSASKLEITATVKNRTVTRSYSIAGLDLCAFAYACLALDLIGKACSAKPPDSPASKLAAEIKLVLEPYLTPADP